MKRSRNRLALFAATLALVAFVTTGFSCSNWERDSFNSLSASKAVIDQAATDYNAGKLPQTAANKLAIEKAQTAQTSAVNAFWAYQEAKRLKSPDANEKQKAVAEMIARLPDVIAAIQSLYH